MKDWRAGGIGVVVFLVGGGCGPNAGMQDCRAGGIGVVVFLVGGGCGPMMAGIAVVEKKISHNTF